MTRDEILNMPAGREMDALIAASVMGWVNVSEVRPNLLTDVIGKPPDFDYKDIVPHYSTDISVAWGIIDKSECYIIDNQVSQEESVDGIKRVNAQVFIGRWGYAEAETAPLAICRAALLAVVESEEKK
jgi:hypothetical protein